MMWQMWTAFGIMLGYASGVVFHNVAGSGEGFRPTNDAGELVLRHDCLRGELLSLRCSWNWRLMLASPMVLPLIVAAYVYTLPESPRWLLNRAHKHKGEEKRYEEAFDSLVRLRPTRLQAARDLFLIHHELLVLDKVATDRPHKPQRPLTTLFTDGRSARALLASVTCMFFQQFCGVNVIAYYSTIILLRQAPSQHRHYSHPSASASSTSSSHYRRSGQSTHSVGEVCSWRPSRSWRSVTH